MKKILTMLLLASAVQAAQGAERYAESFAGRSASADGTLSIGAGNWQFDGSNARVAFGTTAPFALPDVATLTPAAGAFTGNYTAAGIEVIGLRFFASAQPPSSLYLEIAGGTSIYQRIFAVTPSSSWQIHMASLAGFDEGGWTVKEGSAANFQEAMADVHSVAIKIVRSGATAREYAVDELFIDGLPKAAAGATPAGDAPSLAWDNLQTGASYVLQQSPALDGPWRDALVRVATNRLEQIPLPPNAAGSSFYRLRAP